MMTDIAKQRRAFARRVEHVCGAAGYCVTLHNTGPWLRFLLDQRLVRNPCALCGLDQRIVGALFTSVPIGWHAICSQCADYPDDDFICEVIAMLSTCQKQLPLELRK
jgi:hypothetical protein